jgi:hypothetical protein
LRKQPTTTPNTDRDRERDRDRDRDTDGCAVAGKESKGVRRWYIEKNMKKKITGENF